MDKVAFPPEIRASRAERTGRKDGAAGASADQSIIRVSARPVSQEPRSFCSGAPTAYARIAENRATRNPRIDSAVGARDNPARGHTEAVPILAVAHSRRKNRIGRVDTKPSYHHNRFLGPLPDTCLRRPAIGRTSAPRQERTTGELYGSRATQVGPY